VAETVAGPPVSLTNLAIVAPPGETSRAISVRSNEHDERTNISGSNEIVSMKFLFFHVGYRFVLQINP
jgi:hypothetical protein